MFTTAFLQHSGKGPLRHEESLLETGLRRRGIPVEYYTVKRIHRPCTEPVPRRWQQLLAGRDDSVFD
ncbi:MULTISPECIES: hypothetical protein [unclassified Nocardia]|uniref:hypothetical protein n=1 Tax=unclassified Nocardia TaxID=2637762 RepID=UPI0024A908DE|nr:MULTISPECIES: hypothetical protein [unclassified Nocardia]